MNSPFFIICSGRSGSTLLAGMLNMHPSLHVPVELGGLYSSLPHRLPHFGDLHHPFNRELLANELAHTGHLAQFEASFDCKKFEHCLRHSGNDLQSVLLSFYDTLLDHSGKDRIGDKTPDHMPYFQDITRIFPHARIIHLVRDGRDCALSSMAWRSGINYRNTWELAQSWARDNPGVASWGRSNPERYLLIRYEDLIDDTEHTLRQVTTHLGEPYTPDMLDFCRSEFAQANASRLNHHTNLAREIIPGNHDKWRRSMPERQLRLYESIAAPALREFGYDVRFGRAITAADRAEGIRERAATRYRKVMRKLRRARTETTFLIAISLKRRLRVLRIRESISSFFAKRL